MKEELNEMPTQGTTIDNKSVVVYEDTNNVLSKDVTILDWVKAFATMWVLNPFTWATVIGMTIVMICAL